jgi:peptide chain release factor 2
MKDMDYVRIRVDPGSLGEESVCWARMLVMMYRRWAERQGLKVTEVQPGTIEVDGGVPSAIAGSETGVHRLVRISPFDEQKLRHTSFAYVQAFHSRSKYRPPATAQWGGQIRNYIIDPYKLVKDVRTEHQTENVWTVLQGDISPFIEAYAKQLCQ